MDDKKDMLKLIEEFSEKQEANESIIGDAKILASELYNEKPRTHRNKRTIYYRALASSLAACIVFLAVFLPTFFYYNKKVESIYYSSEMVYSEKILDINEFVVNNKLNFYYFVGNMGGDSNVASYIIENNNLAFLQQQILFVREEGFDTINLGIVPSEDRFDKFEYYYQFDKNIYIENILIEYKEVSDNSKIHIYSKFNVNNVNYYLKIATAHANGKLGSYIKLLLSDS